MQQRGGLSSPARWKEDLCFRSAEWLEPGFLNMRAAWAWQELGSLRWVEAFQKSLLMFLTCHIFFNGKVTVTGGRMKFETKCFGTFWEAAWSLSVSFLQKKEAAQAEFWSVIHWSNWVFKCIIQSLVKLMIFYFNSDTHLPRSGPNSSWDWLEPLNTRAKRKVTTEYKPSGKQKCYAITILYSKIVLLPFASRLHMKLLTYQRTGGI